MKILALADIHCSDDVKHLIAKVIKDEKPDLITISGDLTTFGPPEWAESFLKGISMPLMVVNGNCDTLAVQEVMRSTGCLINGECSEHHGLIIMGLPWPTLSPDDAQCDSCDIIISHEPPKGYNDTLKPQSGVEPFCNPKKGSPEFIQQIQVSSCLTNQNSTQTSNKGYNDNAYGNIMVSQIIYNVKPRLVITGHIHEARGMIEEDGVLYLNPGPAVDGYYALVEINPISDTKNRVETTLTNKNQSASVEVGIDKGSVSAELRQIE